MLSKITAENFLSWKNLEFNVESGVTLIDGFNEDDQTSEGSGKSAILNALSWGLYGKIPKDAKIDDVIKTGESSCRVVLELSNGDVVYRSRKPNELKIMQFNGEGFEDLKGKDAKETQQMVEDLVGLSFETFCQTVYFAQNYDKKFITSNQEDKAKILSEVQDLKIFDKARKEAMNLLKIEETNLSSTQTKITIAQKDRELLVKDLEVEKFKKDQLEKAKEDQLARLMGELRELNGNIENYQTNMNKIDEAIGNFVSEDDSQIRADLGQAELRANQLWDQICNIESVVKARQKKEEMGKKYGAQYQKLQAKINELDVWLQNPTNICPTCNSDLGKADTSHAEKQKADIQVEMNDLMGLLKDIAAELQQPAPTAEELHLELAKEKEKIHQLTTEGLSVQEHNKELDKMQRDLQMVKQYMGFAEGQAKEAARKYQALRDAPIDFDPAKQDQIQLKITTKDEEIETLRGLVESQRKQVGMLQELKDGFKEVKSHVFNSMLNEINARVNQYLERLFEIPVSIKFNNENMKIETDVIINGVSRGLGLLSGGQFRRVSLATDLALSDVISARKNAKLGVLILDEYFKDLSEVSMEKCLELLQQRKQPVILIEHNSIFKNIVDKTFFVKLEKGTSYEQV